MSNEMVMNGIEYRCHKGEGVWLKYQPPGWRPTTS